MFASILEGIGVLIISVGLGFVYAPLFPIALGVGCILFGLAMERNK